MKVLVTGGTGFVGKNLQKVKPEWYYIGAEKIDLISPYSFFDYVEVMRPDAIVHLAAHVGGIKANNDYPERFFYENTMMNLNVVSSAVELSIPRVLSSLSVCAFPDTVKKYPFNEEDLHNGPPNGTNISYGYSKRSLYVHMNACRRQYNFNYSTFSPSNIFGPHDNYNPQTSHFVPALVKKMYDAKDGDTIEFWGTGKPIRQFMYVEDLVRIIPILLEKHNTDLPLIIAPYEKLSIKDMIDAMIEIANKDVKIKFNSKLDGQLRRDGDNSKFIELCGDFDFTPFKGGLRKTYEWYGRQNKLENV